MIKEYTLCSRLCHYGFSFFSIIYVGNHTAHFACIFTLKPQFWFIFVLTSWFQAAFNCGFPLLFSNRSIKGSLIFRLSPGVNENVLQVTESWVGPGNEARSRVLERQHFVLICCSRKAVDTEHGPKN